MELRCLQDSMRESYYIRDKNRGLHATFTWFVEEVGELAEALLKGSREELEEELADVLAWLLSIANLVDVDMENAFIKKYNENIQRCLRKE